VNKEGKKGGKNSPARWQNLYKRESVDNRLRKGRFEGSKEKKTLEIQGSTPPKLKEKDISHLFSSFGKNQGRGS